MDKMVSVSKCGAERLAIDLDNKITAIAVHGHEELFKNLYIVTED